MCFRGGSAVGLDRRIDPREGFLRFEDVTGEIGARLEEAACVGQARGDEGFQQAQSILWRVIDLILRSERHEDGICRIDAGEPGSSARSLVERVRRYLAQNLGRKVRLADIARHVYVSPSTLSHRYRIEAEETPMETLTRLRLHHAKALMLRGLPLKTIAAQLDFVDAFHLSKTFKRHEGMSPTAYLRERRGAGRPIGPGSSCGTRAV